MLVHPCQPALMSLHGQSLHASGYTKRAYLPRTLPVSVLTGMSNPGESCFPYLDRMVRSVSGKPVIQTSRTTGGQSISGLPLVEWPEDSSSAILRDLLCLSKTFSRHLNLPALAMSPPIQYSERRYRPALHMKLYGSDSLWSSGQTVTSPDERRERTLREVFSSLEPKFNISGQSETQKTIAILKSRG